MTLYDLATRYVGIQELTAVGKSHPLIEWWHSLCGGQATDDVPWCSSFLNGMAWELRLPRSKSKAARSWLTVGVPVPFADAKVGDVAIFKRGPGAQPGPDVVNAPGHVGLFAGYDVGGDVLVLGGNQSNAVTVGHQKFADLIGVRRLI